MTEVVADNGWYLEDGVIYKPSGYAWARLDQVLQGGKPMFEVAEDD